MTTPHLSSAPTPDGHLRNLCPCCQSSRVRIRTSVDVIYDVVSQPLDQELLVIDEVLEETGWDPTDEVVCPYCLWTGTVAELQGPA